MILHERGKENCGRRGCGRYLIKHDVIGRIGECQNRLNAISVFRHKIQLTVNCICMGVNIVLNRQCIPTAMATSKRNGRQETSLQCNFYLYGNAKRSWEVQKTTVHVISTVCIVTNESRQLSEVIQHTLPNYSDEIVTFTSGCMWYTLN